MLSYTGLKMTPTHLCKMQIQLYKVGVLGLCSHRELLLGEASGKWGLYLPTGRCLQAGCLMGISSPQLSIELGVFSRRQSEVRRLITQIALQTIRGPQGKLLKGGHLPWIPSACLWVPWDQCEQSGTLQMPGSLSVFFILVFSPSLPEQRLRAEGSTEENSAEFLSSMPSLSLSLWWRLPFAHRYSCMSKGKGRSRLSPGRQPGDQMAIQGTKDCESTLDVEGTSQTRTFKGLPSLNSMLTEKCIIVWATSKRGFSFYLRI